MNVDEYLLEVYRLLRTNFTPDDTSGGMSVAKAAKMVRDAVRKDQTAFGFEKFKDVLKRLEVKCLLRTGPNSKRAFSFWLTGAPLDAPPASQLDAPPASQPYRRLHTHVWHAFVAGTSAQCRYLNRKTGEIHPEANERTSGDEWIKIQPVDVSAEQEHALQFLRERSIDVPEVIASVHSPKWYIDFPKSLNSLYAQQWKRGRTQRVIALVKEWAQRNNVDERMLFDESDIKPSAADTQRGAPDDNKLKRLLLCAIERMSEDELLALTVPVRHLVAVLRPDLID